MSTPPVKDLSPRKGGGVSDALVSNAETARALQAGAPVREIVRAFMRSPFEVGRRIELDPTRPIPHDERGDLVLSEGGGGAITPAAAKKLVTDGARVVGVAVVNRVTPEQLLACVVSLMATSKSASEACVRIRQEVAGWRFENAAGDEISERLDGGPSPSTT